jgi:hypothetical protein
LKTIFPSRKVVLATILGIAALWIGDRIGLWWLMLVAGICAGWFLRNKWQSIYVALLLGLGGWGIDLLVQAFFRNITGLAGLTAILAGLGKQTGFVIILVTLAFACILSLSGLWLGRAAYRMVIDIQALQANLAGVGEKSPR